MNDKIVHVLALLSAATVATVVGTYVHFDGSHWLGTVVMFTTIIHGNVSPNEVHLTVLGFSTGIMMESALWLIDPAITRLALILTAAVFLSVMFATILFKSTFMLTMGSILFYSLCGLLAWNLSVGTSYGELYFGMVLFLLFVIFDTQVMMKGDNVIMCAIQLYLDAVNLFVRILSWLINHLRRR